MNKNQLSEVKETKETRVQKKLEELNLIDDFLFTAAASYGQDGRQLCQSILEIILGRKLPNLKVEVQKVLPAVDTNKHGIRMDVVIREVEGDEGEKSEESVYDIEMENHEFKPKRARYYHALADRKLLDAGDDYRMLGNVFIIVIMPNDPFGKNRIMYTIKRKVIEDFSIDYEDGDTTFYLYTRGTVTDGRQELVDLLHYIEDSNQKNAKGPELEKIHDIINKVKYDRKVGAAYMKSFERERMIMEEARERGLAEGREEGREEERRNTERERQRAEEAEKELERLKEELKNYQEK